MTTYRIGEIADRIVGVNLRLDGGITPIVRRRTPSGDMVDVAAPSVRRSKLAAHVEFVVRVERGHTGVVELVPPQPGFVFARAVIVLGGQRPFLGSELPPSPGANGAFSISEQVAFRWLGDELSWESENMSGRAVLNELYPELAVVLRLPGGSRGSITFSAPIFAGANGNPENMISAA